MVNRHLIYLMAAGYGCSGYAASGIGLSILFQFYRSQPLWIPIGWNAIFLLINATMIGLLLKERNDADKLEEDPEQVWAAMNSCAMNNCVEGCGNKKTMARC